LTQRQLDRDLAPLVADALRRHAADSSECAALLEKLDLPRK
jgi:hypothetical protein